MVIETSDRDRVRGDVWTLFAVTWGASILFHLAGNPRLAPEWGRAVIGACALVLLVLARRPWAALPAAVAVLAGVWLEAPALGNHWLLQGFLALIVIGAVLSGRGRAAAAVPRLLPAARLLLLAFYVFAAFAKLNRDFFDPAVSCAVFYLRESVGSWGALGLYDALPSGADTIVAVLVAGIELTIPVLLIVRRTRHVGVLVAIGFHWVLAIDRSHQFFDFSSVLTALFLLFLDPPVVASLLSRWRRFANSVADRWSSGPELARLGALVGAALAVVAVAGADSWSTVRPLREVGVVVWMAMGAGVFLLVFAGVRRAPVAEERLVGEGAGRWLLLVPALAAANGLTPYLEVKSGFGWNMYSNLAVIDGDTNHFVVRAGLPLTDGHDRLVRIVESSEPGLAFYGDQWLLAEVQLEDYLADLPDAVVLAEVDGERVTYLGGGGGARPAWRQKFQLFRAVDASGPTECQPVFGPAH